MAGRKRKAVLAPLCACTLIFGCGKRHPHTGCPFPSLQNDSTHRNPPLPYVRNPQIRSFRETLSSERGQRKHSRTVRTGKEFVRRIFSLHRPGKLIRIYPEKRTNPQKKLRRDILKTGIFPIYTRYSTTRMPAKVAFQDRFLQQRLSLSLFS